MLQSSETDILYRKDILAEAVTIKAYTAHKELFQRFGTSQDKVREYISHHLTYLSLAIELNSPQFFGDYWEWNRSVLEGRNVPMDELKAFLPLFQSELKKEVAAEYHASVDSAIEQAMAVMEKENVTPPSFLDPEAPHSPLAHEYLKLLLESDRRRATELIHKAVEEEISIEDIYLNVLQPAQREIGRLWQVNEIGVAQEHYATAVTQMIMASLYSKIFASAKNGKRMIAACVGNELHEIGIRMVADIFELSGWATNYLGANTPFSAIQESVDLYSANLVALSMASIDDFRQITKIIESLKTNYGSDLKIMVGGYCFNMLPEMWSRIGADAYADNALEAVNEADKMIP